MHLLTDPMAVLRGELLESLLISYAYSAADANFSIVCDYWNKVPGSDRAFVRMLFDGVASFRRELGVRKVFQGIVERYDGRLATGSPVVQSVKTDVDASGSTVDFWFGPSFGGVSFLYQSVTGQVRSVRVRARGDEYDYFDFETGRLLDFYAPFGS